VTTFLFWSGIAFWVQWTVSGTFLVWAYIWAGWTERQPPPWGGIR
jgi:hypothetical protein